MPRRKDASGRKPGRMRRSRCVAEALESRILLSGANSPAIEQALLNAIDSALQPSSNSGLTAFNSRLKASSALGTNLPIIAGGLSAYDPGAALGTLLSRLGSTTYTSVGGLVTALQNGTGITVTSSSDLLNNIELSLQFSVLSSITFPVNATYGEAITAALATVTPTDL